MPRKVNREVNLELKETADQKCSGSELEVESILCSSRCELRCKKRSFPLSLSESNPQVAGVSLV